MKYKKTILLDLDGVLNEYDGNFDENFIPPMKVGTKDFLNKLSNCFQIKIFTTRNKLLTAKWLINNNLDKYISDITNIKEPAYLYIDDRTICFKDDYKKTLEEIKNFRVHWVPKEQ